MEKLSRCQTDYFDNRNSELAIVFCFFSSQASGRGQVQFALQDCIFRAGDLGEYMYFVCSRGPRGHRLAPLEWTFCPRGAVDDHCDYGWILAGR